MKTKLGIYKKNTAIKRSVALLLAFIMIFMSVNTGLLVHADPDTRGVGINNTVYKPDTDNTSNKFDLTFHSDITGLDVVLPADIILDAANGVYLNKDGTLEILGSQLVKLSDKADKISIISSNKITDITIRSDDGESNVRKDFYYFSSHTQSYNLLPDPTDPNDSGNIYDITVTQTPVYRLDEQGNPVLDENNSPVIDHYENTYSYAFNETKFKNNFTVKNYRSSIISDYEVDVRWYDKDLSLRPENMFGESDFTFERTPENGDPEEPPVNQISLSGSRHVNSNLDAYLFALPMYSSGGKLYTYTVVDAAEANENYSSPKCDGNEVTYIRKTDYTCTVSFSDDAYRKDYSDALDDLGKDIYSLRPAVDGVYIAANFKLYYVDSNGTEQEIAFTADDVVIEDVLDEDDEVNLNKKTLKIKGLDELNERGDLINYYLAPIDSIEAINNQNKLSNIISGDAELADVLTENDKSLDYYSLSLSNKGILFTQRNKLYSGGTMYYSLTGTDNFTVNIDWRDTALIQERLDKYANGESLGSYEVWRVLDNGSSNYYTKIEYIGECDLDRVNSHYVQSEDNDSGVFTLEYTVTYNDSQGIEHSYNTRNVSKYGAGGSRYIYYANGGPDLTDHYNEVIENVYEHASGAVINHGTVLSLLSGTKAIAVTAEWIAAARQGGFATLEYKLQREVTDEHGVTTWEDVYVKDEENNDVQVTLPLGTFYAETMKLGSAFAAVDKYDDQGLAYKYRIVQTNASRNDTVVTGGSSVAASTDQEIVMLINPDGTIKTDAEGKVLFDDGNGGETSAPVITLQYRDGSNNVISTDQYYVTATVSSTGVVEYKYVLRNAIDINLEKTWGGSFGSIDLGAVANDDEAWVKAKLQYYDYTLKKYVDFKENGETVEYTLYKSSNSDENWKQQVSVPRFDSDGHEYIYQIVEPRL